MQLIGRRSSVFTRMALIFAAELDVPLPLEPIADMNGLGPEFYAGNPSLKLPVLRLEGSVLFGALNICRAIAERCNTPKLIIWPEQTAGILSRNAQELVWHGMAAQVQIVMGTVVNALPADNPYFVKARAGLEGALHWLDARVGACIATLPPRGLSVFEVSLFCLVEHIAFRPTIPLDAFPELTAFCSRFGERESARRTAYRLD
jgi:glutathione S-transferase